MFTCTLAPSATVTGAKKEPKREVQWIATAGLHTGTGSDVLGVMSLVEHPSRVKVARCSYVLSEVPTAWDGRAFHLKKAKGDAGKDADNTDYDVFIGRNRQDRQCQCKGFLRWDWCKHVGGVLALIDGGQLPPDEPACCPANPEADTGRTEPYELVNWDF